MQDPSASPSMTGIPAREGAAGERPSLPSEDHRGHAGSGGRLPGEDRRTAETLDGRLSRQRDAVDHTLPDEGEPHARLCRGGVAPR